MITINVVARSIFNQASYIKCIIWEVMPKNCNFSLIIFEHVQLHLPFWVYIKVLEKEMLLVAIRPKSTSLSNFTRFGFALVSVFMI
jgi:hypothetical protein